MRPKTLDAIVYYLCGQFQNSGSLYDLRHADASAEEALKALSQNSLRVVKQSRAVEDDVPQLCLGAAYGVLRVRQGAAHAVRVQLGDKAPEFGEEAEELCRAEAFVSQEQQVLPQHLRGLEENKRVLAQQFLKPDLHVGLLSPKLLVGLLEGAHHHLVLLYWPAEALGSAGHELGDDPFVEVQALEIGDVVPLVVMVAEAGEEGGWEFLNDTNQLFLVWAHGHPQLPLSLHLLWVTEHRLRVNRKDPGNDGARGSHVLQQVSYLLSIGWALMQDPAIKFTDLLDVHREIIESLHGLLVLC